MTTIKPIVFTSYNDAGEGVEITPLEQLSCVRGRVLVCFPGVDRVGNQAANTLPNVVLVQGTMWRATVEQMEMHLAKGKTVVYVTAGDCFTYLHEENIPFTVVYPTADQKADYYRRLCDDGKQYAAENILLNWDKLQSTFRLARTCNHLEIVQGQIWLRDIIEAGFFGK